MIKILKELCSAGTFLNIYSNEYDTSKFIYGKVLALDSTHIALSAVSPCGNFDGIIIKELSSIIRVEVGDKYSEKMSKLMNAANYNELSFLIDPDDVMRSSLETAKTLREVVSLELLNSGDWDITGLIEKIEGEVCVIHQLNEYGGFGGFSYIDPANITEASIASSDERIIMALL